MTYPLHHKGVYFGYFLSTYTSCMIYETCYRGLERDGLQFQFEVVAIFYIFLKNMSILFIAKVKTLMLIKWSYMSSQSRWFLNLEWLAYSEYVVISFKHKYFGANFFYTNQNPMRLIWIVI